LEVDQCNGDNLLDMLSYYPFNDEIDLNLLRDFGWFERAEIIPLKGPVGE
jgi:hypothetical protein